MQVAGLDLKNGTESNYQDFSEGGEDWSERVFLGVSIGIMSVVGLLTLSAILLVCRYNWKLKNYSNIYNNSTNNDIDSLKRYFLIILTFLRYQWMAITVPFFCQRRRQPQCEGFLPVLRVSEIRQLHEDTTITNTTAPALSYPSLYC